MAKAFSQLRGLMAAADVDNYRLGLELNLSASSISDRLTGRQPWKLTEMYKTMNFFRVSHDRLHEIFPENGGVVPYKVIRPRGCRQ